MFRRFLDDRRGAYAIAVVVAMVPLMGGLALAVDFAEMNRQRQATMNALDAAGVATAREAVTGATDDELKAYAKDFFEANLGPVDPAHTELGVVLPNNEGGGGTLKLTAILDYQPYFLPSFRKLLLGASADGTGPISFSASTEVRLKNTLEVALVLDNSGSMAYTGDGSGEKRLDLLKAAAKELVSTLSKQAQQIQKVDKPVQFALVPFAGSVNVGPLNAGEAWMDTKGISPVHHENFDWSSLDDPDKGAANIGGIWYKQGVDWGTEAGEILSRFSLYKDMKKVDSREWIVTGTEWVCTSYRSNGTCRNGYYRETGYYENVIGVYATWQGCVEARPSPYNINGAIPYGDEFGNGDPASLYVPMFAPDDLVQPDRLVPGLELDRGFGQPAQPFAHDGAFQQDVLGLVAARHPDQRILVWLTFRHALSFHGGARSPRQWILARMSSSQIVQQRREGGADIVIAGLFAGVPAVAEAGQKRIEIAVGIRPGGRSVRRNRHVARRLRRRGRRRGGAAPRPDDSISGHRLERHQPDLVPWRTIAGGGVSGAVCVHPAPPLNAAIRAPTAAFVPAGWRRAPNPCSAPCFSAARMVSTRRPKTAMAAFCTLARPANSRVLC